MCNPARASSNSGNEFTSNAGVLGNIVLEEQNFSLTNWPSRPSDLIYGNAFRGDGQHFRIEAAAALALDPKVKEHYCRRLEPSTRWLLDQLDRCRLKATSPS